MRKIGITFAIVVALLASAATAQPPEVTAALGGDAQKITLPLFESPQAHQACEGERGNRVCFSFFYEQATGIGDELAVATIRVRPVGAGSDVRRFSVIAGGNDFIVVLRFAAPAAVVAIGNGEVSGGDVSFDVAIIR